MTLTLDKTETTTTAYTRWRARLSERFGKGSPIRDPANRIDAQSIMVGVMTLVIVGMVIAAAVQAVLEAQSR